MKSKLFKAVSCSIDPFQKTIAKNKYKIYLKLYKQVIRNAQKLYWSARFNLANNGLKLTWNNINYLLRRTNNKSTVPDYFVINNQTIKTPDAIAEESNNFYVN